MAELDFNFNLPSLDEETKDTAGRPLNFDFSLQTSINNGLKSNPESASKAVGISEKTNLSVDMVERNLEELEQHERSNKIVKDLAESPVTSRFMANPDNAKIGHDDVENLAWYEKLWKDFDAVDTFVRAPAGEAVATPGRMVRGVGEAWESLGRYLSVHPLRALGLDEAADFFEKPVLPWWASPSELLKETGGPWVDLGKEIGVPPERQNLATDITGGVGQISAQILIGIFGAPAQVGALFGQGTDIVAQDAELSQGSQADKDAAILTGGAVTALTEKMGLDALLNRVPPKIKSNVLRWITDKAIAGGIEAGQEVIEGIMHNLSAMMTYDPDKNLTEGLDREALAAGGAGALFRTLLGAGRGGAGIMQDRIKANKAKQTEAVIQAMGDNAAASRVRERLPAKYREFVEQVRKAGTVENVYVAPEALRTLYQSFDIGDYEAQIEEAEATGQFVPIPLEDYQTSIAGTDAHKALAGDIKFHTDDMTVNEANQFNDEITDLFESEYQEALKTDETIRKAQAPVDRVFDNVKEQLMTAGETPANATQQAALHKAHAKVMQERYNVDPETIYGNLAIKGPFPESVKSQIDSLDLIIDRTRRGIAASDTKLFGESLQEFARNLGVKDDRGDLEGLDKELKPFQRKMLRDDGQALDDVMTAAVESGFFPENEQMDLAGFIDALTGEELYVEGSGNEAEAARVRASKDLEEMIDRLGIDIDATNEEIKAALDKATGEVGGIEFEQTDAFKKWFGDSKVVDESGKPLVVYHGTDANIVSFDPQKLGVATGANSAGQGFFFTSDHRTAQSYADYSATDVRVQKILKEAENAEKKRDWATYDEKIIEAEKLDAGFADFSNRLNGQNIVPTYLSIKNPLVIDAKGEFYTAIEDNISKQIQNAKRDGYDGVIIKNLDDAVGLTEQIADHYVVFEPSQIKSIHNRGTFDPDDAQILYQDDKLASIQFFPDKTIINLGKNKNLSSFLHESGHFFVNTLSKLAETNEKAAADFGVMMKFAGAETIEGFNQTEPQEKMARAFEAYLREGKAPSTELQGAFSRMRAWLIDVYKTLLKLDVEINDEIRGVFDRLLATDAEIAEAEQVNRFVALDTMSEIMPDGGKAYAEAAQRASEKATDELEKRKIAEETREATAQWKDERVNVRAEVAEEINARPAYRALDLIRDKNPLSRGAVVDMHGEEALKRLPHGITRKEGGIHPDFIADTVGLTSGDELLFALMNNAKNKTERNAEIDAEADKVMKERHGSLTENKGQAAEAASEAVMNDERGQFLAMELKALSVKTGDNPTPASVAKAAAIRIIAGKKSNEAIQVGRYTAASQKASRDATRALLKKDFETAREAKLKQILNHYLAMEARNAKDELDKMSRAFDRSTSKKNSVDPEYREQISALLEKYDFRRAVSLKAIEKRKSLAAWVAEKNENNEPVSVPDNLLNDSKRQHYKDTTMEELRGLKDTVDHLAKVGRLKNRLLSDKAKRELNAVVDEITGSIWQNWKGKTRQRKLSLTDKEKILSRFEHKASLRKTEAFMRELDGFKPGPMHEYLFQIIAKADDNLQERRGEAASTIKEIFEDFTGKEARHLFTHKFFIPEINDSLTKESIISVALNVGNADNRAKLLKGNGWSEAGLEAVLARMNKRDWDMVQSAWDYIDTFWEETVTLDKETKGYAAPKVEAVPVETPYGTYDGGYYPIKYSSRLSDQAKRNNAEDVYKRMVMGDIGRPTTNQGRTKERLAPINGMVIRLDLGTFFEAVDETIHDLSFRKAAIDATKIINHPEMIQTLRETVGETQIDILRDWLVDSVAGDSVVPTSIADKVFSHVRKRATIMAMGYKLTTALVQPLGYTQTMARFIQDAGVVDGLKYSMKGIKDFYGSPATIKKNTEAIYEKSSFMRERARTFDRDIHDATKKLKKGPLSYYEDSFFWHIAKMQLAVDLPTWTAAYGWHLDNYADKGDDAAVEYANSVVRQTQGSGSAKDLAPIQKGGEGQRLFTMFMTYFSSMNNMVIDEAKMLKRNPTPAQITQFSFNMMLLTFIPSVAIEIGYHLAGVGGPDDDESYGEWMAEIWAMHLMSGIPFVRDIASSTIGDFQYEVSPAAGAARNIVKFADQVKQGEIDKALVRAGVKTLGVVSPVPIPTGQALIMGEYFTDYMAGEKDGFNPVEAFVKKDYRN